MSEQFIYHLSAGEIEAIHQRDVREFLGKIGLLELLDKGELKCEICECTITLENTGTIFRHGGRLSVCCNKTDCIEAAMEFAKEPAHDNL